MEGDITVLKEKHDTCNTSSSVQFVEYNLVVKNHFTEHYNFDYLKQIHFLK